jgi:hypothetical protein
MGLCESYSNILEGVEKTMTSDLADEDASIPAVSQLENSEQLCSYISFNLQRERDGEVGRSEFFDLCLSSRSLQ